jgi:hypothetical protein
MAKLIKIWCIKCGGVRCHSVGQYTPGDHNICDICGEHPGSCNGCGEESIADLLEKFPNTR